MIKQLGAIVVDDDLFPIRAIDLIGGEPMDFFDWKIEMPDVLKPYIDIENKRMAILTTEDDEIHMALEFDEDRKLNYRSAYSNRAINLIWIIND